MTDQDRYRYYTSYTDYGDWDRMATDPDRAIDQAVEERVYDYIDEGADWEERRITDGKPLTVYRAYRVNYDALADPRAAVPDEIERTVDADDWWDYVSDALEDQRVDDQDPYEADRKADIRAMNRTTPDRWRRMYG